MNARFGPDVRRYDLHKVLRDTSRTADLWERATGGRVQCRLCPRGCTMPEESVGFCKVRKNIGGTLYTQNYGKATRVVVERIETEAVHHYMPAAKILSLGNFGCNLDCAYCQNWMFSQFQYTPPDLIGSYDADGIIEFALENGVEVLSWTYNDPAVWYEFVVDVARKARKAGLRNLFKSAFFLSPKAVTQLLDVIDVFAISIKAMDPAYYRRFTSGSLAPVLEAARIVARSGIHFEVSNLVVTGLTNNDEAYDRMIDFVASDLGVETPLHFTRFHPDYKYQDRERTPVTDVMKARQRAIDRGLRYVYVGNVFESDGLHTYCATCGIRLVERFGLETRVLPALSSDGSCAGCGSPVPIVEPFRANAATRPLEVSR